VFKKLTATGIVAAAATGVMLLGGPANADRLPANQTAVPAAHLVNGYYPGDPYPGGHYDRDRWDRDRWRNRWDRNRWDRNRWDRNRWDDRHGWNRYQFHPYY
jgi:hypothetical protein